MNAFFTYIFKHQYYKKVIADHNEAITKYSHAYKIWLEHEGVQEFGNFGFQETVASNLQEIKRINTWIQISTTILNTKRKALHWFFNEKGLTSIPDFHYNEYRVVAEHTTYIESLQVTLDTYNQLIKNDKEAIDRYLQTTKNSHSYDEIKRIVLSKEVIVKNTTVLSNAHSLRTKYCLAWKLFANGRNFNDISISELEGLREEDFERKDTFLNLYGKEPELIKLILGSSFLSIESFEQTALEQEEDVSVILAARDIDPIEHYNANIRLENPKELKRAILDSVKYGELCNFSDSYSISQFYGLRADFDRIGAFFDDAVTLVKNNDAAIKLYHQKECGQSCVYIEDYLRIVTEGSPLSLYIQTYREEKNKRDEAKRIKANYPKGFSAIFGGLDLDSCSIQYIEGVINAKSKVQIKDNELERIERDRLEAERKRQAVIRKQQEIRDLKSCVVSWSQPRRSSIDYFSLYNYYPTTCAWDASESEWDVRNLIWDFKANPNKPQSEYEIRIRHEQALNQVLPKLVKVINHFFGSKKSKLTLVCIPSSKRIVTERRYKDLAQKLCSATGMSNGYDYVSVTSDGEAKHLGGTSSAECGIDSNYFKDRYILLFDDVITSGSSMERFKRLLESVGATVIGGLSIGKTKHDRQQSNPIDNIDSDLPF